MALTLKQLRVKVRDSAIPRVAGVLADMGGSSDPAKAPSVLSQLEVLVADLTEWIDAGVNDLDEVLGWQSGASEPVPEPAPEVEPEPVPAPSPLGGIRLGEAIKWQPGADQVSGNIIFEPGFDIPVEA